MNTAIPPRGDVPATIFTAAQAGDPDARRQVVERYLPLVRSLALRFQQRGEPVDDLIQVASLGLLRAIDRFDPARGLAFSSFAVPTVLGEIRRHFRDRTWGIHVPRQLQESSARMSKVRAEMVGRLGRQPTVAELCEATGERAEAVLEALEAGRAYRSGSLDQPVAGEDGDSVGSLLGYDDTGFADVDARVTLEIAARRLTQRQRDVLWLHVDLELTQDEIASRVGISQMQVSRDLAAAREELRDRLTAA